jgi:hypothetical protein
MQSHDGAIQYIPESSTVEPPIAGLTIPLKGKCHEMSNFLTIGKIKVSAYAESTDLIFKIFQQIIHLVSQSL